MDDELVEHRLAWQKYYFSLAEGRASDELALKSIDVVQFFTRVQVWEEDIERKLAILNRK